MKRTLKDIREPPKEAVKIRKGKLAKATVVIQKTKRDLLEKIKRHEAQEDGRTDY